MTGEDRPKVKRGQIYYINNDTGRIGSEIRKTRTAVIVSADFLNRHSGDLIGVFLTTKPKKGMDTHVTIRSIRRESVALCEQPTTISINRLQRYIGKVTENEMQQIEKALLCAMDIKEGGKKKCFQSGYRK